MNIIEKFKIYSFLEKNDHSTFGKWFKIILAPIWFLLEYICYIKYWKKIIVPEMITNDKIFDFLDKNDFQYTGDSFCTKDLLDDYENLRGLSLEESRQKIRKEFVESLFALISENCSLNIEDLLTLQVFTQSIIKKISGEYFRANVYEVCIQYWRLWYLRKAKFSTIVWNAVVFGCGTLIYLMITYITRFFGN